MRDEECNALLLPLCATRGACGRGRQDFDAASANHRRGGRITPLTGSSGHRCPIPITSPVLSIYKGDTYLEWQPLKHAFQCEGLQNNHTSLKKLDIIGRFVLNLQAQSIFSIGRLHKDTRINASNVSSFIKTCQSHNRWIRIKGPQSYMVMTPSLCVEWTLVIGNA